MKPKSENIFQFIKAQPYFGWFALLFFLFFAAQLITEVSINKFELNDFKVYYSAAQNYWSGEQVYGIPFGLDTGYYKYSPVILLFVSPFTLLPYTFAAALYYLINQFVIVLVFYRFIRLIETHFNFKRKPNFLLLLVIQLSFLGHFLRELHLGNTNILLFFCALLMIEAVIKNRQIIAGLLLSVLLLTKPYFGILILPVLLTKKYSIAIYMGISTTILSLLTILFFGFAGSFDLHLEWLISMKEHSDYLSSNNTIFHIINQIFGSQISTQVGLPTYALISILLFLIFWFQEKRNLSFTNKNRIVLTFLLLAIFPNFLVTDTEHFLFSFGMISLLAFHLFEKKAKWTWIPYGVLIVFYLGEANLFLPRSAFDAIKTAGGMGIANMIFVAWSLLSIYSSKKEISA